ncbi:MAG: hypothetical protein Roseis2KO_27750 [Roseivirga sp.]
MFLTRLIYGSEAQLDIAVSYDLESLEHRLISTFHKANSTSKSNTGIFGPKLRSGFNYCLHKNRLHVFYVQKEDELLLNTHVDAEFHARIKISNQGLRIVGITGPQMGYYTSVILNMSLTLFLSSFFLLNPDADHSLIPMIVILTIISLVKLVSLGMATQKILDLGVRIRELLQNDEPSMTS